MADLAELIEKVKAATGPDREIDAQLAYIINYDVDMSISFRTYCEILNLSWPGIAKRAESRQNILCHNLPRWSASLDAVVALAEEVLPGWALGFDCGPKTCMAFCDPHDYEDRMFGGRYIGEAKTPALALLLAILTAKQEASNG